MDSNHSSHNMGLDLVRVTEAAALAAGRWIGSGNFDAAHAAATDAMFNTLTLLQVDGIIAIGEDRLIDGASPLCKGVAFGAGLMPFDLALSLIHI